METSRQREFLLLLALFLLALAVRFFYLWELSRVPFFDVVLKTMDHFNFDQGALHLSQGDWLARSPNNSYAPLFKYFLGGIYYFFGRNFYVIYSIQFILGAVGSVLVYRIASDLFGHRAGLLAFLGFAFYATEIVYEGIILRAAFITFLGILSLYLLSRLQKDLTPARLVLATLSLSLFFQGRPNTLLCLPGVCVYLHQYLFRSLDSTHRKKYWLLFTGTLVLSFIPLLVQCYLVHGRFVFFDASGPTAFIAGNLNRYPGVGYDPKVLEEYVKNHPMEYGSVIRFLTHHILSDPVGFIRLYLRKIYFFLNDFEPPSNLSVYLYKDLSRILPFLWNHFALYSSLGLAGMVLAAVHKKKIFLLSSFTAGLTLSVLLFHIVARFRIIVAPFLIIFAAYAVSFLLDALKRRDFKKFAATAGAAGVLFFLFAEPGNVVRIRQVDYCNLGVAYFNTEEKFDINRIETYALKCWDAERLTDPDHSHAKGLLATTYNLYASAMLKQGNPAEAEKILRRSYSVSPFHVFPYRLLAEIFHEKKEDARAIHILNLGIAANPSDKSLYEHLVNLYHDQKAPPSRIWPGMKRWLALETDPPMKAALTRELARLDEEIVRQEKTTGLSPQRARSYYARQQWERALPEYIRLNAVNRSNDALFLEEGMVRGNLRQYKEALEAFYNGLMIHPGNPEIHRVLGDYYLSVNEPLFALIHLTRYLEHRPAGKELGDEKKKLAALRFNRVHGSWKPLIGPLGPARNREVFELFKSSRVPQAE
ncbi:MAG: glycosyltransferase family 39 protein [Nitrospinaceae bacterium]